MVNTVKCFQGIPKKEFRRRNSKGILRKHDSINTNAFDLKLLHSHCFQMIDCPLQTPYPHTSTPLGRHILNLVWHGITEQEKCSTLELPRGNFCKTQWAGQGVKINQLISIFTSKKVWKFLKKNQLTKSDLTNSTG